METRKKVQYFKVKWLNISEAGNTWEPTSHFIGDPATTALAAFRQKMASRQAAHEAEKAQLRAGKKRATDELVDDEAADATDVDEEEGDEVCVVPTSSKRQRINYRKKQSDVWKFFESKVFYKTQGAYYSKCRLCGTLIKALNTTNQRAHLNSCHAKEMVQFKCDNNKVALFSVNCLHVLQL